MHKVVWASFNEKTCAAIEIATPSDAMGSASSRVVEAIRGRDDKPPMWFVWILPDADVDLEHVKVCFQRMVERIEDEWVRSPREPNRFRMVNNRTKPPVLLQLILPRRTRDVGISVFFER